MATGSNIIIDDGFMGAVAAEGVKLMGEVLSYQNLLRNKQTQVALAQTLMGSQVALQTANAINNSAQHQAISYYLQAGQSLGQALTKGANALHNGLSSADGEAQSKCDELQKEINAHRDLLDKANATQPQVVAKRTVGEDLKEPTQDEKEQIKLLEDPNIQDPAERQANAVAKHDLIKDHIQANPNDDYNAAKNTVETDTAFQTKLADRLKINKTAADKAQKDLEVKTAADNLKKDLTLANKGNDDEALALLGRISATKPDGSPLTNLDGTHVSELDELKTKLQEKIETKQKSIDAKQQQIANAIQNRRNTYDLVGQIVQSSGSTGQAIETNLKGACDAAQKEWEFAQQTSGSVFQAAAGAMNNCSETQTRIVSEITGALKQVMGG